MNKAKGGKSSYRGLGSIDIPAAARSVLICGELKNEEGVRAVVQDKSSLAQRGKPFAFKLDDDGFHWLGEYDISPEELLAVSYTHLDVYKRQGNKYSPTTIVACLSSKIDTKAHLPTHYILPENIGLKYRSMVLCEQIRVIDKKRLLKKISKLSKLDMKHINRKISISLELKDKKY